MLDSCTHGNSWNLKEISRLYTDSRLEITAYCPKCCKMIARLFQTRSIGADGVAVGRLISEIELDATPDAK